MSSEYCHPEIVTQDARNIAERTAWEALEGATESTIETAIRDFELDAEKEGGKKDIAWVLQNIANAGADYSGYETITVTVFPRP